MTQSTAFAKLSQGIAEEFLNSIVVVDDRARFDTSNTPAGTLRRPGRTGALQPEPRQGNPAPDQFHELDAKQIIDNFAARGIICAVLKPEGAEINQIAVQLAHAAHNADVVVLDWVLLNYKQGENTLDMIRALAQQARGERSRLVIVYTGENDLRAIATAINSALSPATKTQDDCTVLHRGMRVAVYAKYGTTVSHDLRARVVSVERLPDVVVKEFAAMTTGLLANVALRSMAVIRDDTFRILQKFNRAADAAYVTHHVLQARDGAPDQLIPLVVSEIQAVLEDHEVESLASSQNIKLWLSNQFRNGLPNPFPHTTAREAKAALNALIAEGPTSERMHQNVQVSQFFRNKNKATKEVRDRLTKLLSVNTHETTDYDHYLAILMSIRSRYRSPRPRLTLGTIVQETDRKKKQYLFCVQPRCDSVRINDVRTFPFLPLKIVMQGRFDIVINDGGQSLKLLLAEQPYATRLIAFCADAVEGEILGRRAKGGSYFAAAQTKRTYRWVADLKADHAQRVAHNYASKLSRVGLTESEWLRRWALESS